jgi:DNA excision repair protein ERCC-6
VLFCTLSPAQRKLYKAYLASRDVAEILAGRRPSMEGITTLRKICNHADLLHRVELSTDPEVEYGALERSSKLQVTMKACLRRSCSWKR